MSLGPGAKAAIYFQLREIYGLTQKDFQSRPSIVIDHLKEMLGKTGSSLIEKMIIKEIRKSFGLVLEESASMDFAISEAKKKFLSQE